MAKAFVEKNKKGVRKYLENTSWVMGEKLFRIATGLIVGIWMARHLGPENFGLLSYAQSLVGLFAGLATLGLDGILVRELVKKEKDRDVLLGTAFLLKLTGSLAVLIIVTLLMLNSSADPTTILIVLFTASGTLFQTFNVIDHFFQSRVLSKYITLANIVGLFLSSVLKIGFILMDCSVSYFAGAIIFDTFILACGFLYYYLKKQGSPFNWKFDLGQAKQLIGDSWPLIIGSIAASVYMKIDQVMIKDMMGEVAVGHYAVAVRLSEVWSFLTIALTQSLAPAVTNAKKQSEELFWGRLQIVYDVLVKASVVISILVFLLSAPLVDILYGEAYQPSSAVLKVYVWSVVFVFLSNGSWLFYLNKNLQKLASIRLICGAIINVVINVYAIENYGLLGAAYTTIISYSISSFFINAISKKTRPNFLIQLRAMLNFLKLESWLKPFKDGMTQEKDD
jgi:O-antigen/teichoic acid export membrane protein